MTVKFINNFSTAIVEAVNSTATVIKIDPNACNCLSGFASGEWIALTIYSVNLGVETEREIVHVTSVNVFEGFLTVIRGAEGTTARAWGAGSYVEGRTTAAGLMSKVDKVAGKRLSTEDYTTADKSKLDGIQAGAQANVATNLGYTAAATSGTITSSTGNNATLPAATTSNAGLLTGADKTKLDGIQAGAQVNVGTNISVSGTGATRTIASSTGSNGTITYSAADIGAAPQNSPSFSGGVKGGVVTLTGTTVDCSLSNYFIRTHNANATYSFTNVPSGSFSFALELNHTGGSITWPASVRWSDGEAPYLLTNKVHVFFFITRNGGSRWYGSALTNCEV